MKLKVFSFSMSIDQPDTVMKEFAEFMKDKEYITTVPIGVIMNLGCFAVLYKEKGE